MIGEKIDCKSLNQNKKHVKYNAEKRSNILKSKLPLFVSEWQM